jgi:hypothetical protein
VTETTAQDALSVRLAVTDGIHRFYDLVDGGRASAAASVFHGDASWTFGPGTPKPGTIAGDEITAAMQARENLKSAFTRHIISNILFDRITASEADVRYQMILFRSDDETRVALPSLVADVSENWVGDEAGFRIMSRTVLPTFAKA